MNAWLITWASPDTKKKERIAAILPAALSKDDIVKIVEAMHNEAFSTLGEQRGYAADPSTNPYPAEVSEPWLEYYRITCGHNPWLDARSVRELTVTAEHTTSGDLVERVTWKEQTASGDW